MLNVSALTCPRCSSPLSQVDLARPFQCPACGNTLMIEKLPNKNEFTLKLVSSADWECPNCHHNNPPATRFCPDCQAKVGRDCPKCGVLIYVGHKHCPACGADVKESERLKTINELKTRLKEIQLERTQVKQKITMYQKERGRLTNPLASLRQSMQSQGRGCLYLAPWLLVMILIYFYARLLDHTTKPVSLVIVGLLLAASLLLIFVDVSRIKNQAVEAITEQVDQAKEAIGSLDSEEQKIRTELGKLQKG